MKVDVGTKFTKLELDQAERSVRSASAGMNMAASAAMVNRTHRVVRERARVMQARRSRDRSLLLPLLVCSALLMLSALAVWTGLYQYQANEAVQVDLSEMTSVMDANNHALVVLLWFAPVLLAFLATLWVRRSRMSDDEAS